MELLHHMLQLCLLLYETAWPYIQLPMWLYYFTFPQVMNASSCYSTSLTAFGVVTVPDFGHCHRCLFIGEGGAWSNLKTAIVKCGKGTSRPFKSFTQSILSLHNHVRQFLIRTLCLHGWVQFLKQLRLVPPPWHSCPPDQDVPFVEGKGRHCWILGGPGRWRKEGKDLPLRGSFKQSRALPSSLYYSALRGLNHLTLGKARVYRCENHRQAENILSPIYHEGLVSK